MSEVHDLEFKLEKADQANNTLKNYIEELHDQLNFNKDQTDAYREQILELSQTQDDVSEDAIQKSFRSVFDGVESWIDELLTSQPGFDDQFSHRFTTRLQDPEVESFLADITNDAGVDWMRVGRSQNCIYTILSLIIGYRLQNDLFRLPEASRYGHIYPTELPVEHMRVLSQVQARIMSQTGPESDIRASRWRREAVAAWMTDSDGEEKLADRLLQRLHDCISFSTGYTLSFKQIKSMQAKITDRALRALRLIAGSSNEYVFLGSKNRPGQYHSSSSGWTAKDVYTWNERTRPLERGGVLALLFPGLSRETDSRRPGSTLVHPSFLVGSTKSRTPSPRKPGTKTPTRESSSTGDSCAHVGRKVRPQLSGSEAKERAPDSKSTSAGFLDSFGLFTSVRQTQPKSLKGLIPRPKAKTQRKFKTEDPSHSPKSAATFPASRQRGSRSITSSGRRRRAGVDLEDEIAHGLEEAQVGYGPQYEYQMRTVEDPGEYAVSQSYSEDRATWNIGQDLGQRTRSRSFSHM